MWHWLTTTGHLYSALIGWGVGFVMASILGVAGTKSVASRLKKILQQHEKTQREIASSLDTNTPGGLTQVVQKLDKLNTTIESELNTTIGSERGQE